MNIPISILEHLENYTNKFFRKPHEDIWHITFIYEEKVDLKPKHLNVDIWPISCKLFTELANSDI